MAVSKHDIRSGTTGQADHIDYIVQMLGELHRLADSQKHDMLCYLLEMAYLEANEIQLKSRS